jgi:hypothetical protein
VRRVAARAVFAASALVLLAACGSTEDADTESASISTPLQSTGTEEATHRAPAGTTESAPEKACPPAFTDGREGTAVASEVDDFTGETPVWLCRYVRSPDASDERWSEWTLVSTPVRVDTDHADLVTTFAAGLAPADESAPCRADFGPRLLLSHEVGDGEQAHAVIDEFGCDTVTLTSDLAHDVLSWNAESFTPRSTAVAALAALVPKS